MGFTPAPLLSNPFHFNNYNTLGPSSGAIDPQTMIQGHILPDLVQPPLEENLSGPRIGPALFDYMVQEASAALQRQYRPARQMGQNGQQHFGKLMVGSLAGLM
ncbi:hypothetical protein B0O99DRAFT_692064 [Bisporella sp. PMI_857]|nr:hypothetical protein B0O99DRAFT_692064 [Bisporella sp. PMI_857]